MNENWCDIMIVLISTCVIDLIVYKDIVGIVGVSCRVDISSIISIDLSVVDSSTNECSINHKGDINTSSSSWSQWSYKVRSCICSTCCPIGVRQDKSCWDVVDQLNIVCCCITLVEQCNREGYQWSWHQWCSWSAGKCLSECKVVDSNISLNLSPIVIIFVSTCIVDLVVDSWLSSSTIGLIWCRVDISSIVCTDLRSVDKSTSGWSIVDEVDSNCSSSSWSEWSYKWSCS